MNGDSGARTSNLLTPARLREHAGLPDSIGWAGQARQLLRWAADLIEAAEAVVAERRSDETTGELQVTDDQIKHMVNRFLGWRLPANFSPDAGISFQPEYNVEYNAAQGKPPDRHEPSGTNLFDAVQAEALVRYMIQGMPGSSEKANECKPGFTQACSSFGDDPDAPGCCSYCGQPREAHPQKGPV